MCLAESKIAPAQCTRKRDTRRMGSSCCSTASSGSASTLPSMVEYMSPMALASISSVMRASTEPSRASPAGTTCVDSLASPRLRACSSVGRAASPRRRKPACRELARRIHCCTCSTTCRRRRAAWLALFGPWMKSPSASRPLMAAAMRYSSSVAAPSSPSASRMRDSVCSTRSTARRMVVCTPEATSYSSRMRSCAAVNWPSHRLWRKPTASVSSQSA
mmetsp:Transcript_7347/g.24863  ORF Transcript_7347/g.24863 Transcript_7347/m.24863 type:complete len:218 (+) Transcript_7347:338-991(+)